MQEYVLMAITTLLVTVQSYKSESQSREFVDEDAEYQRRANSHFHNWRAKMETPQMLEYNTATLLNPIIFNPLFTRFFTPAETAEKTLKMPLYEIEKQQYNQNGGTEAGHTRVPSHSKENSTTSITNVVNQSAPETHDKRIIGNNSYEEQINNSATIEYLPTITTPFLDSITHGIIGEIQQHVQLIKPGTKWCGDGNKARSYEDVGVLYKTDKCCRTHDKCPYYILAHETKYGLQNDAHFTRSHCDCDASFYDCLKKVNSPFSTGVGITYFNILKMKCFRLEYPVLMCSQTAGWFSKHCIEYVVDMRKEKQWQWFDNYEF